MMCRAFSFPAEVMAAPPTGLVPIASHSRCTASPALRRITPARPPPSLRSLFAAFTMASASISVRSPCCKMIFSAILMAHMIISELDFGPRSTSFCDSAARNHRGAGACERIRPDAIAGFEQAQRGAAGGLLRFRHGGQLCQHGAAGAVVAVFVGIDDVAIESGQFALPDAVEESEKLHVSAPAHGFARHKRGGNAFGCSRELAQIIQHRAGR